MTALTLQTLLLLGLAYLAGCTVACLLRQMLGRAPAVRSAPVERAAVAPAAPMQAPPVNVTRTAAPPVTVQRPPAAQPAAAPVRDAFRRADSIEPAANVAPRAPATVAPTTSRVENFERSLTGSAPPVARPVAAPPVAAAPAPVQAPPVVKPAPAPPVAAAPVQAPPAARPVAVAPVVPAPVVPAPAPVQATAVAVVPAPAPPVVQPVAAPPVATATAVAATVAAAATAVAAAAAAARPEAPPPTVRVQAPSAPMPAVMPGPVSPAPAVQVPAVAAVDDLKRIRLIDAGIETALNKLGVRRYAEIAAWKPDDVARVSKELGFKGRIEQDNWIEQAQILARGEETFYSRRLSRGEQASARLVGDEGER